MDASALASSTRVHGWNMSGLRLLAMLVALGVTWATMAPTVTLGQPGCGCGGGGRRPYGDYCPRNDGVTEDALCRATLRPGEDPGMGQGWLRPPLQAAGHIAGGIYFDVQLFPMRLDRAFVALGVPVRASRCSRASPRDCSGRRPTSGRLLKARGIEKRVPLRNYVV